MVIKLLSTQIPAYWETIKYAAIKADLVEEKNVTAYSTQLLFDLLNDKAVCLVSLDVEKNIQRVLVISFILNEITKTKQMFFKVLYSFKHGSAEDWEKESMEVYNFAKKEGCNSITVTTKNPAIKALAVKYGFAEESINYSIKL